MADNLNSIRDKIAADEYAAFRELYLLMYTPLLRFATNYTNNHEESEDVLADVFLKLWNKREDLSQIQNLRVYLYTAVKNTALNHINRQRHVPMEDNDFSGLMAEGQDPEASAISAEMVQHIQKAIHQLPPRCKLIFQLAKEEGMRYKEIASILDLSIKTIDNQLAIALARIGESITTLQKNKYG